MFDLTTSRDFYAMVVADFDDYMAEPHSARRALHCALSAYHLREWVWHDWIEQNPAIRDRPVLNFRDQQIDKPARHGFNRLAERRKRRAQILRQRLIIIPGDGDIRADLQAN